MKIQKYTVYLLFAALVLGACKRSTLQLPNPNSPTPDASLVTESGINAFAQGIFSKWINNISPDGNLNYFQVQWSMESNMGDEDFSPFSNWGGRYPACVDTIILPAPYNVRVPNPAAKNQINLLRSENSRVAGDGNSIQYEWDVFYFINAQANTLLHALDNPALVLSGDAATKKKLMQAWAYYWKGYSYSKIGSMYLAGLIDDSPDSASKGLTSNVYVAHDAVLAAATKNFEQAVSIFRTLSVTADYTSTFSAIVPSFNLNTQVIPPTMWIRQIRSFEARNYLANHKIATMTTTDWTTITTLADSGLVKGDVTLMWGMAAGGLNDLSGAAYHPFEMHNQGTALSYVSERLIQDYQLNDLRFTNNFIPYPGGAVVNVLNRGIQFGTRFIPKYIENGGAYATNSHQGYVPIAPTWEETTLMIAEAKIRSGSDIEGGLALIDQVRDFQGSGLAHVAGTSLTPAQAAEQLRSERRVGLYLRGVAWYDARRWGVTAARALGGGRPNANILVPGSLLVPPGTTPVPPATLLPCFMVYNFVDYWDVPQNELDFNPAGAGSAKIAN